MRVLYLAEGLVIALMGWISSVSADGPLQYEPAVIQLSGAIVLEHHYGPPNFGETPEIDREICILVLELESPVSVVADHSGGANVDSFRDVRAVQLLSSKDLGLGQYVGQKVTVEGTLFEKQSGEHYTDVLMNVQKVTLEDY